MLSELLVALSHIFYHIYAQIVPGREKQGCKKKKRHNHKIQEKPLFARLFADNL